MRSPFTEWTQLILAISTAAADPCRPERCPSMTVDPIVGSHCERCSQVGERPLTLPVGANDEHPGRCPQHDDRPVDDPPPHIRSGLCFSRTDSFCRNCRPMGAVSGQTYSSWSWTNYWGTC